MQNDTQPLNQATDQVKPNTMGINMEELLDEWRLSKSYVEQYTRDFKDLDNLVDGVPINKQDDVPFVGDTTLAGLVRGIPRQSLQQLPVFSVAVNGTKNSIPALLCTYLLKKTAFNEDTFGKGLLSTLQIGAEQALTHGYAPFMSAMGSMYNDFGTTMRLIHYSDTSIEPGVTDANESGYHYVVASLTPSRVRKILKNAKSNDDTKWNIHALEALLAATPRAKDYSIYESDPRKQKGGETGPTYELITRTETGSDATSVTFSPEIIDEPLRVQESLSKWGYPKVQYLVIDPAALSPFGISRVRLASPNQNLMNIYYGNIAAMLLLNSKPPIFKRGRFTKPVSLKAGTVWESMDPQATAELKTLDNGALAQFPNFAQQFATQMQNIMGVPGGLGNNAAGGSAGFSKTAPGVKQQDEVQSLSTNQITKILENFLRQYALVALDTLLSEQEGKTKIIVDDETKNAINNLRAGTIGDDNKIGMDWARFYAAIEEWSVEITVSLSKDEMETKKRGDLQDMLVVLAQNAEALGPEAQQKVQEITDMLMQDITPDVKPITVGSQAPPTPPAAPGNANVGGAVHETGDLVKLFTETTDPNIRNAILKAMQLPPESAQATALNMAANAPAPVRPPAPVA